MALLDDTPTAGPDDDALRPPHSIAAEQAVLGAIFFDNETYHALSPFLRAEHFYEPVHGRLFEQAAKLIARNERADPTKLAGYAAQDEGLRQLGGITYLADLFAAHVAIPAAKDYGRFVYDLALRRQLIQTGATISDEASKDLERSAQALIENAERQLFQLAETGGLERGFKTFSESLAAAIEVATNAFEDGGGFSGLRTHFHGLDQKLGGLHPSDLIILAGRPSMGKTALATNVAMNVANAGGVVGFFSLEMSAEQLAMRLLADRSGVSSHLIRRGDVELEEFERIRDAAREIEAAPLHIDETGGLPISALTTKARRLKRTSGLDLVVVDYLQLVTPASGGKKSDSRVQEVSEVTQALKALAKELEVPVVALSQLSRQVESRDDKRPQLSDLRESGSIEQDADVVMFVYREAYYVARSEPKSEAQTSEKYLEWKARMEQVDRKAEVIIGKQRHGPIGTVEMGFEDRLTRFHDLVDPALEHSFDQAAQGQSFQDKIGQERGQSGPGLGR